jgi:hypothetical protein
MTSITIIQAIIAAGTAIFVSAVGYLQWRTAEQKAALDLFERRRAIYDVIQRSVCQMLSSSAGFDLQRLAQFTEAREQAYFFFGDDVEAYLEHLRQDIIDVRSADDELKGLLDPLIVDRLSSAVGRPSIGSANSPNGGSRSSAST